VCLGEKSGCTATTPAGALENAGDVTASGRDLYVGSLQAISLLTLSSTGKPTFQGCIGNLAGCTTTTPAGALANAQGLAVRGQDLYATSVSSNALSYLTRITPTATITQATIDQKAHEATFKFTASGTTTGFECALVRGQGATPTFAGCKSPKTYAHLTAGAYTFEVRAVSAAGTGPIAKHKFTI
jgi:hypothetical protein